MTPHCADCGAGRPRTGSHGRDQAPAQARLQYFLRHHWHRITRNLNGLPANNTHDNHGPRYQQYTPTRSRRAILFAPARFFRLHRIRVDL